MPIELNALSPIDPANVSDDDLLLIWDTAAPSGNAKKATRAQILTGVVMSGSDADLGVVTADDIQAPSGSIDSLTVATGIHMGSTLNAIKLNAQTIALADITTGASASHSLTVSGVIVGDFVLISAPSTIPAGVMVNGYASATDIITLRLFNATASTLAAASHDFRLLVLRAS